MSHEFKAFSKIEQLKRAQMQVTQKIHGTNAQVSILPDPTTGELKIYTGSRTRWIYPGDDNYGFAAFVHANAAEFIKKLGQGVHFGEWAGPGINSGEGLSEKTFLLFDFWRYPTERPLPPQTAVVPVLYSGPMDLAKVDELMADLKANGSKLVAGYMRPEGVVISVLGTRYKKVFDAEETQRTKSSGANIPKEPGVDYGHLCQPIRLEKLVSRDEKFKIDFPKSLPDLVRAYFEDLVAEAQIAGEPGEIKAIRKGASSQIFSFVRHWMEENS